MNLDPDLLRAFVAVCSHQSFTKAAESLNRTQSTVSHQIRRLEEMLGSQLFKRSSRSVCLTVTGSSFLEVAGQILELNRQVGEIFSNDKTCRRWRVGLNESIPAQFAAGIVRYCAAQMPGSEVSFRFGMSGSLQEAVAAGDLDIALITVVASDTEGETILWRKPLAWVAAKNWKPITDTLPLILCAAPCTNREAALATLQCQGTSWIETVTVSTYGKIVEAVRSGLGVSVIVPDEVDDNLRLLTEEDGFPPLPDLTTMLVHDVSVKNIRSFSKAIWESWMNKAGSEFNMPI